MPGMATPNKRSGSEFPRHDAVRRSFMVVAVVLLLRTNTRSTPAAPRDAARNGG